MDFNHSRSLQDNWTSLESVSGMPDLCCNLRLLPLHRWPTSTWCRKEAPHNIRRATTLCSPKPWCPTPRLRGPPGQLPRPHPPPLRRLPCRWTRQWPVSNSRSNFRNSSSNNSSSSSTLSSKCSSSSSRSELSKTREVSCRCLATCNLAAIFWSRSCGCRSPWARYPRARPDWSTSPKSISCSCISRWEEPKAFLPVLRFNLDRLNSSQPSNHNSVWRWKEEFGKDWSLWSEGGGRQEKYIRREN